MNNSNENRIGVDELSAIEKYSDKFEANPVESLIDHWNNHKAWEFMSLDSYLMCGVMFNNGEMLDDFYLLYKINHQKELLK